MFHFVRKHTFFTLFVMIFVLALLARLYRITSPLADWHSFRQADTASVTREYVKHGVDFLHPKYHDLSNVQSGENNDGKDNVEGWRMVEFPLVNGLLAYVLRAFPWLDVVIVSRLASVIASLFSLTFLILLVKRVYGERTALVTGFFFAVLPYSMFYSRAILPEPFFIALTLGSLWVYQEYVYGKNKKWLFGSAVLFALALLVKPMAAFFIPVFLGIRFSKAYNIQLKDVGTGLVFALSFIPLLLWRQWILNYPIGIPISAWLYNGVGKGTNLLPVYKIRFKPAWWRWIFYERLTKLFLGYIGTIPFAAGFISALMGPQEKRRSRLVFLFSWTIGAFLYVSVFAAGNVQHDYYQAPLVPFVSLILGVGVLFIYDMCRKISPRFIAVSVCLVLVAGSWMLAWKRVSGYYHINHWDIVDAGKAADKILPSDAKVIAPYGGDTAFLFQTNRTGWPLGQDIEKKIQEGASYYITTSYDDEANELRKKYTVVISTKEYLILDLTKPTK